jgi:hypothetical protein
LTDEPRGLAWRRWRRTVRTARVHAFVRRRHASSYEQPLNLLRGWRIRYERRLSISERELLTVFSVDDFRLFLVWEARKLRDNAKTCCCHMCRNPRHSHFSRPHDKLTLQEQIAVRIGFDDTV